MEREIFSIAGDQMGESTVMQPEAVGNFAVQFDIEIARIRIIDVDESQVLLDIGAAATIDDFCAVNGRMRTARVTPPTMRPPLTLATV